MPGGGASVARLFLSFGTMNVHSFGWRWAGRYYWSTIENLLHLTGILCFICPSINIGVERGQVGSAKIWLFFSYADRWYMPLPVFQWWGWTVFTDTRHDRDRRKPGTGICRLLSYLFFAPIPFSSVHRRVEHCMVFAPVLAASFIKIIIVSRGWMLVYSINHFYLLTKKQVHFSGFSQPATENQKEIAALPNWKNT